MTICAPVHDRTRERPVLIHLAGPFVARPEAGGDKLWPMRHHESKIPRCHADSGLDVCFWYHIYPRGALMLTGLPQEQTSQPTR